MISNDFSDEFEDHVAHSDLMKSLCGGSSDFFRDKGKECGIECR